MFYIIITTIASRDTFWIEKYSKDIAIALDAGLKVKIPN